MWRFVILGVVIIGIVVFGFSMIETSGNSDVSASAFMSDMPVDTRSYARAIGEWNWQFPEDFGAHPEFQTEWWYYTGNLADENERRFGYQFTIFRRAITPQTTDSDSEWRADQVYMVHFTVSDVEGGQFYHDERYSRGSAGLAGATVDPRYHVWLEDWQITALDDEAMQTRIAASSDEVAINLMLEQIKPPALQGENGLSPKGEEPGNASYYYSLSRLLTDGVIRIGDQSFNVTGTSWKDHEFSTSALGGDALGWDWFGLQFDDNRELMIGQIRLVEGGKEPAFGGLLINEDGSTRYLKAEDFTINATGEWTSPHTGAVYPAGWEVNISGENDDSLDFTVTPLLDDQELNSGQIAYWEGAVRLTGDVTGYGYAELTGYADTMTGRF
jgi:predicted secreted hydrolase